MRIRAPRPRAVARRRPRGRGSRGDDPQDAQRRPRSAEVTDQVQHGIGLLVYSRSPSITITLVWSAAGSPHTQSARNRVTLQERHRAVAQRAVPSKTTVTMTSIVPRPGNRHGEPNCAAACTGCNAVTHVGTHAETSTGRAGPESVWDYRARRPWCPATSWSASCTRHVLAESKPGRCGSWHRPRAGVLHSAGDVDWSHLHEVSLRTVCEYKGVASYARPTPARRSGGARRSVGDWYPRPSPGYGTWSTRSVSIRSGWTCVRSLVRR